jgi:hypothetical protein
MIKRVLAYGCNFLTQLSQDFLGPVLLVRTAQYGNLAESTVLDRCPPVSETNSELGHLSCCCLAYLELNM